MSDEAGVTQSAEFDGRHDACPNDPIDPLALALFGIRDHVSHHHGCLNKRGIGGHHFDAADECALADIVRRYGDVRATGSHISPGERA